MLEDDVVLRSARYWAYKFQTSRISFNDLVSLCYIVGKPLRDPRLLKSWMYYTCLHYIQEDMKNTNYTELAKAHIQLSCYDTNLRQQMIKTRCQEFIDKSGLSPQEYQAISLIYFQSLTQQQAAEIMDCGRRTVCEYVQRALTKMRKLIKSSEEQL
ncbi:MAG: sigma-70 family RNA polymerase sigma factor [Candidatus Heimdallarchaeota archaeon]